MINDVDYYSVHVCVDTLPQSIKLNFCPSLVGPNQTGLVQPALLPLITGENGTRGSPWKPIYSSSGSSETGPDYWQMKLYLYHTIDEIRGTAKKQGYLSVWMLAKLLNELSSECS